MRHLMNLTFFAVILSLMMTPTSQDSTSEEPREHANVPELPPRGIKHRVPPLPPRPQNGNVVRKRLIYGSRCFNELPTQSSSGRPYIAWIESSSNGNPELILQKQYLEEGADWIPQILSDHWCLHEGQVITIEDCNIQCKAVDKGKKVTKGLCMHNVCFCEWATPEDGYQITYRTLEDSVGYEGKLTKFIRESSFIDTSGDSSLYEEPQPSCSVAGPWGSCQAEPSSTRSDVCLHGEERIYEEECDRRCLEFGRTSGAKIKKGFCSDGQCRCKYYRYGICLSKKLKSLERREHEEMAEQFVRLAEDLNESRIMLDSTHHFYCRRFNEYHRM